MKHLFPLIALAVGSIACSTGSSSTTSTSSVKATGAAAGTSAPTSTAGATKPTKIPQVGLSADLGESAMVMDGMDKTQATVSTDACTLTVSVAKPTDPKTVQQGKDGALLGDKGRGLKGDTIADGWVVTWENTGSMGDNYWLEMRREIAGKGYMCSTMQSNEAQRQCAVAICKSLKP